MLTSAWRRRALTPCSLLDHSLCCERFVNKASEVLVAACRNSHSQVGGEEPALKRRPSDSKPTLLKEQKCVLLLCKKESRKNGITDMLAKDHKQMQEDSV